MKTINLELSKRLQKHLKNIETEYIYADNWLAVWKFILVKQWYKLNESNYYKTLTLEEAIDSLPIKIWWDFILTINRMVWEEKGTFTSLISENKIESLNYIISYIRDFKEIYEVVWDYWEFWEELFKESLIGDWKTLLQAVEIMLECLLDNNLLTK